MDFLPYTVSYQVGVVGPKTLKNVLEDGFIADPSGMIPVRWFRLQDGRRVEVSAFNTVFVFSKQREESAKKMAEVAAERKAAAEKAAAEKAGTQV